MKNEKIEENVKKSEEWVWEKYEQMILEEKMDFLL